MSKFWFWEISKDANCQFDQFWKAKIAISPENQTYKIQNYSKFDFWKTTVYSLVMEHYVHLLFRIEIMLLLHTEICFWYLLEFYWNTLYLQNWFSYLVLQSILASEQAQLMILNHKKIKIGNDFITGSRVYKVCYGLVINLYIFKITRRWNI